MKCFQRRISPKQGKNQQIIDKNIFTITFISYGFKYKKLRK